MGNGAYYNGQYIQTQPMEQYYYPNNNQMNVY